MTTAIGSDMYTLLDWMNHYNKDGTLSKIAEMLERNVSIIHDLVMQEGSLPNGHEVTMRTGIPSGTWRLVNTGTQPSKSTLKKITLSAGMAEEICAIDEILVDNKPNGPDIRAREAMPFIQSMGQTWASNTFYGDVRVNPDRFTGLCAYYNVANRAYRLNPQALVNPSTTLPDSGRNVIDASEDGNGNPRYGTPSDGYNTSLWLITTSPTSTHYFFPMGSQAGLFHEDRDKVFMDDGRGVGAMLWKYAEVFRMHGGLAVPDWRQNVRICNIDTRTLLNISGDNDNAPLLIQNALQARNLIARPSDGKQYWYCNSVLKTALETIAINKPNSMLNTAIVDGVSVTTLLGIPVHLCDAIMNTEAEVA